MTEVRARSSEPEDSCNLQPTDPLGQIWNLDPAQLPSECFQPLLPEANTVMGLYVYVMKGVDDQRSPHGEHEAYYVLAIEGEGEVTIQIGRPGAPDYELRPVRVHDLIYVAAGQVHCFHMASEQVLKTAVFFAPPWTDGGEEQCGLRD